MTSFAGEAEADEVEPTELEGEPAGCKGESPWEPALRVVAVRSMLLVTRLSGTILDKSCGDPYNVSVATIPRLGA